MIAVISPAKTLDFSTIKGDFSLPILLNETTKLITILKQKSVSDIQALMKLSSNLAQLNHQRYQDFNSNFSIINAKAAIFAFKGDVYTGLEVESFDAKDIQFANKSVRILSGLYGILNPLDVIQPYRLEMGTRLSIKNNKNLYQFWGNKISLEINKIENDYLINLASNEYFKAIDKKTLVAKIININFKENKNGIYKIIGIYAKKARGKMINFMVKNKITDPQSLKYFKFDNYSFNANLSHEFDWVFTR